MIVSLLHLLLIVTEMKGNPLGMDRKNIDDE